MGTVQKAVEATASTDVEQVSPRKTIRHMLDTNRHAIGASLPRGMDADRFARLLLTAANTNPQLFECDPTSFLAAGVAAAQLGLEPNDARGLAYLLPFRDKNRGMVVQLIIGYRGMVDLARRSGMVTSINAFAVFEGDRFDYRLGLDPTIDHVPTGEHEDDPAFLTHVYAVAKVSGDPQFVVLTRKQIEAARMSSPTGRNNAGPWKTHYVEMALKTSIRRLCKYLPQTVEVARALDAEERPLALADFGGFVPADHGDDVIDVDPATGEILSGTPQAVES